MKISCKDLKIPYCQLKEELLPLLLGKVFHVTSSKGYKGIIEEGAIKHNRDEKFDFTFSQSKGSYGRKRGYVCLFNLKDVSGENIKEALYRYYFLNPFNDYYPHFLFISSHITDSLISWKVAVKESNYKEMFIPYVEYWYPTDLPLKYVESVIRVKILSQRKDYVLWD